MAETLRRESAPAGLWNRISGALTRAAHRADYYLAIKRANVFRSRYNPLRGLTIQRAVAHLEAGERGAYAELQWLYRYIERRDAVLGALVDRRLGAIRKLDWSVKIPDGLPARARSMAARQQASLKAAYEALDGLGEAFSALAHASFRGYSHVEKVIEGGRIARLEYVPQWNWVRDGLDGAWELNLSATFGAHRGEEVDPDRLIIRECERPINEVAIVSFIRKSLSQKDWDAFVETYGVPAIFLILPPDLSEPDRAGFQDVAERIAGNGRGVLPGNSDVKTVDNGARGVNPFRDHLKYQDEMLVLRATGGKLTMLNDATGIGGSQADVHQDVFDDLAQAEAMEISQLLQRQLDPDLLRQSGHGDEPALAYFELAANEETDAGEFLEGVAKLSGAGWQAAADQIEEKTGYKVTPKGGGKAGAEAAPPVRNRARDLSDMLPGIRNRGDFSQEPTLAEMGRAALQAALAADNGPLIERLGEALRAGDMERLTGMLDELSSDLPAFMADTTAQEGSWESQLAAAWLEGLLEDEEDAGIHKIEANQKRLKK